MLALLVPSFSTLPKTLLCARRHVRSSCLAEAESVVAESWGWNSVMGMDLSQPFWLHGPIATTMLRAGKYLVRSEGIGCFQLVPWGCGKRGRSIPCFSSFFLLQGILLEHSHVLAANGDGSSHSQFPHTHLMNALPKRNLPLICFSVSILSCCSVFPSEVVVTGFPSRLRGSQHRDCFPLASRWRRSAPPGRTFFRPGFSAVCVWCPFWWFCSKNRGRFLVYLVVSSSARETHLIISPKGTPMAVLVFGGQAAFSKARGAVRLELCFDSIFQRRL